MADVLIELDDDVIKLFKIKAKLKGRSLEEELRARIVAAADLVPEEGHTTRER